MILSKDLSLDKLGALLGVKRKWFGLEPDRFYSRRVVVAFARMDIFKPLVSEK